MGVFWGSFAEREPAKSMQNLGQLLQWLQQGKIKQHIHRIYTLNEAAESIQT